MRWKLNLPESPMPLYYWAKLIGLAPFTVKNHKIHPPTFLEKLYPISVAAGYLVLMLALMPPKIFKAISDSTGPNPLELWILSEIYTGFLTTFLTMVILVLSYENILTLMNNLCTMSNELKTLSIEEECGKLFKNNLVTTATTNLVFTTSCVVAYVLEPPGDKLQLIEYSIGRMFTINILLIHSRVLICIRQRFTLLNERLLTVFKPAQRAGSPRDLLTFAMSQRSGEENQSDGKTLTDLQNIRKIETLHLELCDLVDRTTHLFNTPILLNIYELFGTLTLSCYWIYRNVAESIHHCDKEPIAALHISAIISSVLRITLILLETLIIADASSTTCEQGNAMQVVLFKVWKKFKPVGLKNEFAMFSVQITHKPVVISVLGIFGVSYSYICKIVGTGIAYIIILIQMRVSPSCS